MAWSGREKHRDREPGARHAGEPPVAGRVFALPDAERARIAAELRRIDLARTTLEAQQDPRNRQMIRDLKAAADHIFDVVNGLDEV
jgi:hypothetical protein